jgi:hypothetical protein
MPKFETWIGAQTIENGTDLIPLDQYPRNSPRRSESLVTTKNESLTCVHKEFVSPSAIINFSRHRLLSSMPVPLPHLVQMGLSRG